MLGDLFLKKNKSHLKALCHAHVLCVSFLGGWRTNSGEKIVWHGWEKVRIHLNKRSETSLWTLIFGKTYEDTSSLTESCHLQSLCAPSFMRVDTYSIVTHFVSFIFHNGPRVHHHHHHHDHHHQLDHQSLDVHHVGSCPTILLKPASTKIKGEASFE